MPVKIMMSWEPRHTRWWKVIQGKRYVVSCRQLKKLSYLPIGSPDTKEHSRDAANRWLSDQLKVSQEESTRFGDVIAEMKQRKAWLLSQGYKDHAKGYDKTIEMIRDMEADETLHPSIARALVEPKQDVWADRISRMKQVPTDRTVGYWIDQFLALRMTEVQAKELSQAAYDQCQYALNAFKEWLGKDTSVDRINSEQWVSWYKHVQLLGKASWTKKKLFSYPKSFTGWLIEQGLIPPFESLHAKRYKFSIERKEEEPLPVERVKEILGKAQGMLRLHLLLMLNCGFSQKDISDLTPSEYADGRITRARSKTKKRGTRVVTWKLWDSTRELLDQFKQPAGDRLLLTSNGTTWVGEGRRDGINSLYRHLKFHESLKQFRSTSGNMIQKQFNKDLADHFLGHKQKSVESAYFSRDQQELDQAVAWLATQYNS